MNKNKKTILTVDCGTQSLRVMLFDLNGNILCSHREGYAPNTTPQPGWAEQDVSVYWNAMKIGINMMKQKAPNEFACIAGMGVCTIRATTVLIDNNGKVLRPAIVWLDNRTANPPYKPNSIMRGILNKLGYYEPMFTVQSNCKTNWLKENEPDIWDKTWKQLLLSGWFIYKLTGKVCDTVSSMVGYVPFVNKKREWAKPNSLETKLMPLEEEKRHSLIESGSVIGGLTKEVADELGLPENLPLVGCGSDKACETIGVGVVDSSLASLSFGTTATIEVCTDKYFEYKKIFPAYCGILPNTWLSELEIFRGYWMISWFKKELGQKECEEAEKLGIIPEVILDKLLDAAPEGGRGLMLQPYWGASVFDRYAKGSIIGFGDVHGTAMQKSCGFRRSVAKRFNMSNYGKYFKQKFNPQ